MVAVNRPRSLAALPKAELHLHLEGSILWQTARECVRAAGLPELPEVAPFAARDFRFRGFGEFLDGFRSYMLPSFVSLALYRRHARELAERLRDHNVRYLELNFAPGLALLQRLPVAGVIEALHQGFTDIAGAPALALIAGFSRDNGVAHALAVAAAAFACDGLAGMDLHGADEANWPPDRFHELFRQAGDAGLLLKAHAGEFAGPASIQAAVAQVGVTRLGHALTLVEDPALSERVRAAGVTLECCPTSNWKLGRIPTRSAHPLRALLAAGHRVSVCVDDMLLFDNPPTAECEVLRCELQCPDAEIAALMDHAFAAAVAPDAIRARWRAAVRQWLVGGDVVLTP